MICLLCALRQEWCKLARSYILSVNRILGQYSCQLDLSHVQLGAPPAMAAQDASPEDLYPAKQALEVRLPCLSRVAVRILWHLLQNLLLYAPVRVPAVIFDPIHSTRTGRNWSALPINPTPTGDCKLDVFMG